MTLYTDLGVSPDASPEDIVKAHRAGVKRHHPDTGGDRAQFEVIQRAALVLRDPTRRAKYDATGNADSEPDNAQAQVVSMVVGAFDAVIAQADLASADIAALARRHLTSQREQARGTKRKAEADLKRLCDALDRLKFKGAGSNPVAYMLKDRLKATDAGIAQLDNVIGHFTQAIEIASKYSWMCDQKGFDTGWEYGPVPSAKPHYPEGFGIYR